MQTMQENNSPVIEQELSQQPISIAKDLTDKINSLRAITTCHNLLGEAMLPVRAHEAIKESQAFLKALHEQLLAECLTHPDAAKVPDLAPFVSNT